MRECSPIFDRTALLVGAAAMERLAQTRVIVFGVGGVGSWCAESLIRSGIGHLTVVDSDRVSTSNVNRQAMATSLTVGQVKVEALRERLLQISPGSDVQAVQEIYSAATAPLFRLQEYDYVIDAIDSLTNKMELIVQASDKKLATAIDGHRRPTLFSSMGAALKMDPTQVRVSEFWEVDGCPLAAALRRRMRRQKRFPGHKFKCVWSPEVLPNLGANDGFGTDKLLDDSSLHTPGRADLASHDWNSSKAQINGTMAHITAIMGFTLAGLVVQDAVQS